MSSSVVKVSSPPPPLTSLVENIGYGAGHTLYELQVKRQDDGWLAVVKVTGTVGLLVAFVGASTFSELLEKLGDEGETNGLKWSVDKYPPRWRLKQLGLKL